MTNTQPSGGNEPELPMLPSLPRKSKRAKTILSGPEIASILRQMGVSRGQFCRLTGVNEVRFKRQLAGNEDGDIPLIYEIVLFALYHHPELRTTKDPIDLPFSEWGLDITLEDDELPVTLPRDRTS